MRSHGMLFYEIQYEGYAAEGDLDVPILMP
jgi:hypothetical protein